MEFVIALLVIVYIVLLVLGFKLTWDFAVNVALAGSSGILLPIIVFILVILAAGPIMGIISIVKRLVAKHKKPEADHEA